MSYFRPRVAPVVSSTPRDVLKNKTSYSLYNPCSKDCSARAAANYTSQQGVVDGSPLQCRKEDWRWTPLNHYRFLYWIIWGAKNSDENMNLWPISGIIMRLLIELLNMLQKIVLKLHFLLTPLYVSKPALRLNKILNMSICLVDNGGLFALVLSTKSARKRLILLSWA